MKYDELIKLESDIWKGKRTVFEVKLTLEEASEVKGVLVDALSDLRNEIIANDYPGAEGDGEEHQRLQNRHAVLEQAVRKFH